MPKADTKIDLKNKLVLPGLIDVHVHLRDEGNAYKEDFYSGTAAAAAGGVTTVLDMPNNDPVTMSAKTLRKRIKSAERKNLVNVGFYSEFPKNLKETEKIVNEGAVAFKLYLAEQIGGLNIVDDHALTEAFKILGKMQTPVAVHAEDKMALEKIRGELERHDQNDIQTFLQAHPESAEVKAVKRVLNVAEQTDVPLHICHVSTMNGLKAIIDGKKSEIKVTCEVTPHHLFLSTGDLRKIGTLLLTTPPVRAKHHASALWNTLKDDWIDIVASDHAPHTLEEKTAESIWDVRAGIPGLETTLPLLLTEVKNRRLSIANVVKLMSEKPAEIFGLEGRGCLREGNIADLIVVDSDRKHKIDASRFYSKAKFSPFDGWDVEGKPVKTFVSGSLVFDEEEIVARAGTGKIIRRKSES